MRRPLVSAGKMTAPLGAVIPAIENVYDESREEDIYLNR